MNSTNNLLMCINLIYTGFESRDEKSVEDQRRYSSVLGLTTVKVLLSIGLEEIFIGQMKVLEQ